MLNTLNQSIARQIANAYCEEDELCKTSLFGRLNILFTDAIFNQFLSTLQTRAYLTGNFYNEGYSRFNTVKIRFQYMDVIKGTVGYARKLVPLSLFDNQTPAKFNALLKLFVPSLEYVTKYADGTILFFNPDYGYEIAYTGTPVVGGGSTGGTGGTVSTGDGGTEPAGTIYTPGSSIVPDAPTQEIISKQQNNFNVNSLLLPAVALAAVFLLKDKF